MKWTLLIVAAGAVWAGEKKGVPQPPPLDRFVMEANARSAQAPPPSPGSLWQPGARLGDAARDLRASQVDDIVTIQVVENASAVAKGSTKTQRASSLNASASALGGITSKTGPLANLAGISNANTLNGDGATSRDMVISTTLTARVTAVLPNGAMLVESVKDLQINSERQSIIVRGIARPADISADNAIRSDRLAQLEVRVNGKGVVGDAIRRPNFLYRLVLGLLPF